MNPSMNPDMFVVVLLLFSLHLVSSQNTDKDFRWRECPENLTAYSGCYYTVIAFLESDNQSCILPQNYNIIVSINNKEYEGSDLNIEQVNGSDLFCEVSTTFLVEEVDHNVTFLALSYSSGSVDNQMCVDLLEVNSTIPPPTDISFEPFDDDTIVIEWTAPDLLEGYAIDVYKVLIDDIGYNNTTTTTNISVTLDDGILYNRQYDVQIIPHYCNGYGTVSSITIDIAGAPKVEETISYSFQILNNTYVAVLLQLVVSSSVGFDTSDLFDIIYKFNSSSITVTNINVTITKEITLNYSLPIDHYCKGELAWRIDNKLYHIRNISINTSSELSCNIPLQQTNLFCISTCCQDDDSVSDSKSCQYNYNNFHYAPSKATNFFCDGSYSVKCNNINATYTSTSEIRPATSSVCTPSPTIENITTPSISMKDTIIYILISMLCISMCGHIFCLSFICRKRIKKRIEKLKRSKKAQPVSITQTGDRSDQITGITYVPDNRNDDDEFVPSEPYPATDDLITVPVITVKSNQSRNSEEDATRPPQDQQDNEEDDGLH